MKKYKEKIWKELEEFCRLCDPSTKYMETCDQCEKRWYVNRLAEAREEIERLQNEYEQTDHYCKQWQERYGNILDKYLKF